MTPELISSSTRRAVLGMGSTGRSVARFWKEQGIPFMALDTRDQLRGDMDLRRELKGVEARFGDLDTELMRSIDLMVASPGIAMDSPEITQARAAGVEICGDIDLFVAEAKVPVIGITGSNGKSTVTTYVGRLLESCGLRVAIGGNLGVPALDLLDEEADVYVLELSSFQLERAGALNLAVAAVLNLSPDHLDRHQTMPLYHLAKHRIFAGAESVVANCRDPLTLPIGKGDVPWTLWRENEPDLNQLGIRSVSGEPWICYEFTPLFKCADLPVIGSHNHHNVLAALAIGHAMGFSYQQLIAGLPLLKGLPHRCEPIGEINAVQFINDSKGTNVGASISALSGVSSGCNVVLIAGGESKGQSFEPLAKAVKQYCKHLILIGAASEEIAAVLPQEVSVESVDTMENAVASAMEAASEGDVVLLSPACASFDMFDNYVSRGESFREAVANLSQAVMQ